MLAKTGWGWVLAVLLMPWVAIAGQPYVGIEQRLTAEQLHATGLDTLSPAQLELLNRLLAGQPPGAENTAVTPAQAEQEQASHGDGDAKSFTGRLKGSVSEWEPGTVFELENGQKWKVLKGSVKLRTPLHEPEIVISTGVVGRWFLQVVEDMPRARVYRID